MTSLVLYVHPELEKAASDEGIAAFRTHWHSIWLTAQADVYPLLYDMPIDLTLRPRSYRLEDSDGNVLTAGTVPSEEELQAAVKKYSKYYVEPWNAAGSYLYQDSWHAAVDKLGKHLDNAGNTYVAVHPGAGVKPADYPPPPPAPEEQELQVIYDELKHYHAAVKDMQKNMEVLQAQMEAAEHAMPAWTPVGPTDTEWAWNKEAGLWEGKTLPEPVPLGVVELTALTELGKPGTAAQAEKLGLLSPDTTITGKMSEAEYDQLQEYLKAVDQYKLPGSAYGKAPGPKGS
jgi:hypothetical protein